ncbi:MAG: ATP-binding protein [Anaerostipes sp.]|uniref:ATP-binding protein n=1 Tax=Enterocloster bolteae TaxID=208479 RepID=UPI00210910A7|nr:ATP-binding protein [Enterocloster bolteae]MCQ4756918.1 ATP-binding protein [Enterocloster bolteae]MDD4370734.1 ATP-binding protein [Anaerostipes sp.]
MARENLVFNSLRLNMNNPQHVKINEILCSIDKDVCKSKNQFIIDAIEFYIENFGKEVLIKEDNSTRYVTTDELEEIKQEIMEAAMTEARREVIRVLGTAVSGSRVTESVAKAAIVNTEHEPEAPQDDEVVSGLATSWMPEM